MFNGEGDVIDELDVVGEGGGKDGAPPLKGFPLLPLITGDKVGVDGKLLQVLPIAPTGVDTGLDESGEGA